MILGTLKYISIK